MIKTVFFKFSLLTVFLSQATMAQQAEIREAPSITIQTAGGPRVFDSFDDIVEAAKSGKVSVNDLRDGISLTRTALRYEEIKTNVKYTVAAAGVALMIFYSGRARFFQGYADKMAINKTYTLAERNELVEFAKIQRRQAMKSLVYVGIPATIASMVVGMLPSDRARLDSELKVLDDSLTEALDLRKKLEKAKAIE